MLKLSTAILISYFIGAIPFSYIIGLKYKQNLFTKGNKKSGSANVLKTVGIKPAVLAFTGDFAKGSGTIVVARALGFDSSIVLVLAMSTIVGHWKSIFIRLKGGDGFATLGGITLAIFNVAGFAAVFIGLSISYLSKFFKYSSTLCIPGGYIILLITTRNVNLQITGVGVMYFLVFMKSHTGFLKQKYLK
mgnify:CR=1 FL=1|jgi:glycerol-3-phosphate acyltransferase PlsY